MLEFIFNPNPFDLGWQSRVILALIGALFMCIGVLAHMLGDALKDNDQLEEDFETLLDLHEALEKEANRLVDVMEAYMQRQEEITKPSNN